MSRTTQAPPPRVYRFHLRFKPTDIKRLNTIARMVELGELGSESVDLYAKAAKATAMHEPLDVICTNPREAHEMAAAFSMLGTSLPTVEMAPAR